VCVEESPAGCANRDRPCDVDGTLDRRRDRGCYRSLPRRCASIAVALRPERIVLHQRFSRARYIRRLRGRCRPSELVGDVYDPHGWLSRVRIRRRRDAERVE